MPAFLPQESFWASSRVNSIALNEAPGDPKDHCFIERVGPRKFST